MGCDVSNHPLECGNLHLLVIKLIVIETSLVHVSDIVECMGQHLVEGRSKVFPLKSVSEELPPRFETEIKVFDVTARVQNGNFTRCATEVIPKIIQLILIGLNVFPGDGRTAMRTLRVAIRVDRNTTDVFLAVGARDFEQVFLFSQFRAPRFEDLDFRFEVFGLHGVPYLSPQIGQKTATRIRLSNRMGPSKRSTPMVILGFLWRSFSIVS